MSRISEHRLRNDLLVRSNIKLANGATLGIPPGTPEYVQEWARAMSQVPCIVASAVPDPAIPGKMKLNISDRESNLPREQIEMLVRALGGR